MPVMEKEQTEYLTVKEAAVILETPYTTVLDWIKAGKFPAYRFGGKWKVKKDELEAWRKEQRNM